MYLYSLFVSSALSNKWCRKVADPEGHLAPLRESTVDHRPISRIDLDPLFPTDHRPRARVDQGHRQADHRWPLPVDLGPPPAEPLAPPEQVRDRRVFVGSGRPFGLPALSI